MKILKNILLLLIISGVFAITSCEKIDDPFEGVEGGGGGEPVDTGNGGNPVVINADSIWGDTGNITIRKMLTEEISGQLCGFCPPKTAILSNIIDNTHKGKVYGVTYHATSFADPNAKYPTDYRTEKGTAFNQKLGNSDAPVAVFSRTIIDSSLVVQGSKFETAFNKLEADGYFNNPKFQLKILGIHNKDNDARSIVVTAKALAATSGVHTAIIFIIEDKIIGQQKWYNNPNGPTDLTDYPHRHVFRDAIGSTDGNAFINSDLAAGEEVSKTFTVDLKPEWDLKKVRLVVAIRDNNTGQILQVDEIHAEKE